MQMLCPSHDDLRGFSLGAVPEARVQELEAHLGECPACLTALQGLSVNDTLTDAVRTIEISRHKLPTGDTVTQTIARMKVLPAVGPNHDLAMAHLLERLDPPQAPDEIGRVGPYRILGVLGRGGMGIVLVGEDTLLGRRAAIKVLSPLLAERENARQRFLREARAAAGIAHPAVVDIYHVGEQNGLPYMAMAYLEGESLATRIHREGPLPRADVLTIGRELAEGLAAAHRHGTLHRDVKPQNVWLEFHPDQAGKPDRRYQVKLLDFGLSWSADQGEPLTDPGTVIGTPAYMAPEQAAGAKADTRSDLFALGSVLYTMCTGRPPFAGDSVYAILDQVRWATPRPLREQVPSIPAGLMTVVERLHAKDPARRFQNASDVARALTRLPCSAQGEVPMRRFRFKASVAVALVLAFGIATLLAEVGGVPGIGPRPHDNVPALTLTAAGELPLVPVVSQGDQDPAVGAPKEKKGGQPKAGPVVYPAALFPFEERGTGVKDFGGKVTDLLFARLVTKPDLYLVDRADLKKVQAELELNLSGVVKAGDATKIGQLTGAKILISGSVIQVDKRTYLVAKIVGTETSRIIGVSVDGKAGDELAPLIDKLADQIAEKVKEEAPKLVAKDVSKADRLANLKKALKDAARPTVIVLIRETHVGAPRIDPAAQTEIMRLCKETGFTVLDPEEALKSKADIVISGEAFSETATRNGNLISVKVRVELRATERKTDQVLTADRQTSLVVDLAEQNAAKAALEDAAGILAERVLPKLVKQ